MAGRRWEVYSNAELWVIAEWGGFEAETVFEDREGNRIVFTGKSFQPIEDSEDRYVGMCVGDIWKIIGTFDDLFDVS